MKKQFVMLLLVLAVSIIPADAAELKQYVIGSGGGVASADSIRAIVTIGQTAVGTVNSIGTIHYIGFWTADLPTPELVGDIA